MSLNRTALVKLLCLLLFAAALLFTDLFQWVIASLHYGLELLIEKKI